jgi:hypothetical protein
VAHEFVGAEADRVLLEAVVPDLLDVPPGHDPALARDHRAVEGHEVRPRLVQMDAHAQGPATSMSRTFSFRIL